jgi:DNA end-binding protein Ku
MAARSIGSGTISFGLVSIPVKLYSATQPKAGLSFNLLHAKDGSRLKQQYLCVKDDEIVPRDQMIKGYEFAKDRYVTFTEEELKALEEKGSGGIEISEFLPVDRIDPTYFDKTYYLGPDKGGDKAYRLLSEALQKTGRIALARYAARGKQHLVMVRPHDGGLVLQQLLYSDEVRSFSDVPHETPAVKDAELKLAIQLIEQGATEKFKPENYKDEWIQRTQELIQKKVDGEEISLAPEPASGGQIIDLMEALKASLSGKPAAGAKPGPESEPETDRKPARRAPRRSAEAAPEKSKASKN